jgi:methylmalonyl-CoA mutase N-terminal domain/subunit
MGGTQSLHTNGYDEALSLPTQEAARIALRTQQIIAEESGICDTVDPWAGSYFIEELTAKVEEGAMKLMEKIDAMGGAVQAIEQGFIQEQIARSSYAYQQAIEKNERIIVGVNKYVEDEQTNIPIMKIDAAIEQEQIERLRQFKANRNMEKVTACLQAITEAAQGTKNLMPLVIEAVEQHCTLGEISHTLRAVWGEYRN